MSSVFGSSSLSVKTTLGWYHTVNWLSWIPHKMFAESFHAILWTMLPMRADTHPLLRTRMYKNCYLLPGTHTEAKVSSVLLVSPILQTLGSLPRWRTEVKWRSRFLSIRAIFLSLDGPHWSKAISKTSIYRNTHKWTKTRGWRGGKRNKRPEIGRSQVTVCFTNC